MSSRYIQYTSIYYIQRMLLLQAMLLSISLVHADIFDECINVTDRTFVASAKSCSHYIFCDGDNSYDGECSGDDYFNEIYQTCDPKDLVVCNIPSQSTGTTLATTTVPITIVLNSTMTTFDLTNATASIISATPTTQPSSETTIVIANTSMVATATEIPNIPLTNSTSTTMSTLIMHTKCPIFDDQQQMVFLAHPKSCSDYYVCYHGQAIAMHCSRMLHFNVRTGKCDYPENAKCKTDTATPKEQCQAHTVDLYPHSSNCNYFYYCRNGYLMLYQCPFAFGWDVERRACVVLSLAKCYNSQKRL